MSIICTKLLSITFSDGTGILTDPETGLVVTGSEGSYLFPLPIGTSPLSVPLPIIPIQFLMVRNLSPAGLATPLAPSLSSVSGGSLTLATYYVKTTLVNSVGETPGSAEASLVVAANNLLVVQPPTQQTGASGWNAYVGTTSGGETKQNAIPIGFGLSWQVPTTGLISGSAVPSSNTTVSVLTVTWSPQGATSVKVLDLQPQGDLTYCEPTSPYVAPSTGGITALSLQASVAGTPAKIIVAG